jgi:hypothetical protein
VTMDLSDAVSFARTNQWSVLTTIRGSGRPQLSNVGHLVAPDGLIRISATGPSTTTAPESRGGRCASSVTARARLYELHRSCVSADTILAHAQEIEPALRIKSNEAGTFAGHTRGHSIATNGDFYMATDTCQIPWSRM